MAFSYGNFKINVSLLLLYLTSLQNVQYLYTAPELPDTFQCLQKCSIILLVEFLWYFYLYNLSHIFCMFVICSMPTEIIINIASLIFSFEYRSVIIVMLYQCGNAASHFKSTTQ